MQQTANPSRTFVLGLIGLIGIVLSGMYALNAIVDPLWHLRGNLVSKVSHRFDERTMKLNYLLNRLDQYDCVIFGASRATLLDESLIEESKCYNLAFSLGHIREFTLVSEYLKSRGFSPERIIVSIDEISFQPRAATQGQRLPAYVREMARPKWSIEDYLGKTPLRFSFRSLFDRPTFLRAYERREDGSYQGILQPTDQVYEPVKTMLITSQHLEPYDTEMLEEFARFRSVFPDAEYEAYVSPISDWLQARIDLTGNLEKYIKLRHELAGLFEGGFWDTSVPNELTADPSLTIDGEHYFEAANKTITDCLNGDRSKCGADVRSLSVEDYSALILPPIRALIEDEGLTTVIAPKGQANLAGDGA